MINKYVNIRQNKKATNIIQIDATVSRKISTTDLLGIINRAPKNSYIKVYIFGDECYGDSQLRNGVICKKYKNWLNVPEVMNTDYGNWTIATYHLDICEVVQPYLNKKPNKVQICMEINTKRFKYYNWRLAEKTMKSGGGEPDKICIHIVCYLNLPDKTAASDTDYYIIDYSDKSVGFMEYCKKRGCKQIV